MKITKDTRVTGNEVSKKRFPFSRENDGVDSIAIPNLHSESNVCLPRRVLEKGFWEFAMTTVPSVILTASWREVDSLYITFLWKKHPAFKNVKRDSILWITGIIRSIIFKI